MTSADRVPEPSGADLVRLHDPDTKLVPGPELGPDEHPTLAGWGNLPSPGVEVRGEDLRALTAGRVLSRGLGRAYGDSALPPPGELEVAGTVLADRILGFDPETGVMHAEAGLSLHAINRLLIPRGFFPPVTPGTQFVTLGGAVAADVHGKNHHVAGCFGQHVRRLLMRVADGRVLWCSREEHPDLFWATIGGMGLTGHILEVEFRMDRIPSTWIWGETLRVPDITEYVRMLKESAGDWPMTMGWIDCVSKGRKLGRGVLFRGRWATADEARAKPARPFSRLTLPFMLPSWTLNPLSVRVFNAGVYWKPTHGLKPVHWESFFYPLDKVRHWNRAYGRKGFTQYQCVLPDEAGPEAARRFLEVLTSTPGGTSFLCVIKDCGPQSEAMLSFPRRGISIALDIPVRRDTQALVDRLNEATLAEGGRIYLAKDAFTRPDHFRAMEGERLERFMEVRRRWDPQLRMRSAQSVRVLGDPAGPGVQTGSPKV
jgi:decaprenylphospho-beta-D-ribofuranose 2-oxidase